MSWDCGFFIPTNSVFRKEQPKVGDKFNEKSCSNCASCNHPIGVISITLYQIDDKHYCADCYVRTVITNAVDRDHSDIKLAKQMLKQSTR